MINYSNHLANMKKSKILVRGMLGTIFFVLRGSVRCLHFVLRYYSVRDLRCSRSKMEWISLLSRVWRPVSIAKASPKVRNAPAMTPKPVEAS